MKFCRLGNGSAISKALSKHPKVFSDFYVNMVRSGEESGKLEQTFATGEPGRAWTRMINRVPLEDWLIFELPVLCC